MGTRRLRTVIGHLQPQLGVRVTSSPTKETKSITPEAEAAKLEAKFMDIFQSAIFATQIHIGWKLNLYQILIQETEPITSAQLAQKSKLKERWVREWLYGQASAGLVNYLANGDERKFSIDDDPTKKYSFFMSQPQKDMITGMAPLFITLKTFYGHLDRVQEAFRTGRGMHYDEHGEELTSAIAYMNFPWMQDNFLELLKFVNNGKALQHLDKGTQVVEVGSGAGKLLTWLAKKFPKSQFIGLDVSEHALSMATEGAKTEGLKNIKFIHPKHSPVLPNSCGLIITQDCLHDMTYPSKVVTDIRKWITDDGVWICTDEKAFQHLSDNIKRNPFAPMSYGFSVCLCMSSALSEPDGEGLGTLGLSPEKLKSIANKAGFKHFRVMKEGPINPVQHIYEIKP